VGLLEKFKKWMVRTLEEPFCKAELVKVEMLLEESSKQASPGAGEQTVSTTK